MYECTNAKPPPKNRSRVPEVFSLSEPNFSVSIAPSIFDVLSAWDIAQPADNLFLQSKYLSVIENAPPHGMRFCYLVFYKKKNLVGVAYCQGLNFKAEKSIKDVKRGKYPSCFKTFGQFLKSLVASKVDYNLLTCGNLLLTGEHGFYFNPTKVREKFAIKLLEEALTHAEEFCEEKNLKTDGIFIKDFYSNHNRFGKGLIEKKFYEFTFHPNMILLLKPEWDSFGTYLDALTSKYRVRAKRAVKIASQIERKELSYRQILNNTTRLYELYRRVAENADFNMVHLHENYLPELKQAFDQDFRLYGYYLHGELVGYYSTFRNHADLEAHFLGFDPRCNKKYQLYLNMLFDIIQHGIRQGAERIIFARTAMEIKSSVGAVPHEMYCYLRASNPLANKILNPVLQYLRPEDDWVPRNPFR